MISKAHIATGHGGQDWMLKHLSQKNVNIATEAVEVFKSYWLVCQEETSQTIGDVVRHILSR